MKKFFIALLILILMFAGMPLRLDDMPVSLDEYGNISLQLIMIVKIERINN